MIVRELLATFGLSYDAKGADQAEAGIAGVLQKAQGFVGAMAGAFAFNELKGFVTNFVHMGDELGDVSQRIGVGVESLQELRYAAERGGSSAEAMDQSLTILGRHLGEVGKGEGEASKLFAELGMNAKNADGTMKSTEQILGDVSEAMGKQTTQAGKLRIATRLFGPAGASMVGVLGEGSEALDQLRGEARDTGGIIGADLVDQASEANDAMLRFNFRVQGLKNSLMSALLPGVTSAIEAFGKWVQGISNLARNTTIAKGALETMAILGAGAAAVLLAQWLPAILGISKVALGFMFIAALLDEIHQLFSGGKSLIGEYLDKFGGIGTADALVRNHAAGLKILKEWWDDLCVSVMRFIHYLEKVYDTLTALEQMKDNLPKTAAEAAAAGPKTQLKKYGGGYGQGYNKAMSDLAKAREKAARDREETLAWGPALGRGSGAKADVIHEGRASATAVADHRAAQALWSSGKSTVATINQGDVTVNVTGHGRFDPDKLAKQLHDVMEKANRDAAEALSETTDGADDDDIDDGVDFGGEE